MACADGGLFIEIARECRVAYGGTVRVSMLCGRDAAERIVDWDYGVPGAIEEMLGNSACWWRLAAESTLRRQSLAHAIGRLELDGEFDHVSASEVRRRIAAGEAWEHLVPPRCVTKCGELYR